MKAITQHRYGSPDVLRLAEVEPPVPAENEILVRVHAASLNARDWHILRGDPYLARLLLPAMAGLNGPKRTIRGSDFAGRVAALGPGVTGYQIGDEVYGLCERDGAFAEYLSVHTGVVARKPANLTFEQAAAAPLAGLTAMLGLRAGRVRPGQRVLINGASGGVGTFAVQIAKASGADVTAVCSTRNVELVESLGADHIVDHTREDFTRTGFMGTALGYDMVFDLVANRTLTELRRVLAPEGTLILSGGGVSGNGKVSFFGPISLTIKGTVVARFIRQRVHVLSEVHPTEENLAELRDVLESGQVTPIIDRTYPLAEVPEAIRYLEVEHARAKVVVTL